MDLVLAPLKVGTRIWSFVGKELIEISRRPAALVTLVIAPFVIMALFGLGYRNERRPLDTVIVLPEDSTLPRDSETYQKLGGPAVRILAVTGELEAARDLLQRQRIDLVVITPPDAEARFLAGHQSVIQVEYNQIDPIRDSYTRFIARSQVQDLNREIIQRVVGVGQQFIVQSNSAGRIATIPAAVIAAPTRSETKNWSPFSPSVVVFFAPAVLALVLQHIGVTLTALSNVRERSSGIVDLFRVAPIGAIEILLGKYLAYGLLNGGIAAASVALLVQGLGVPLRGEIGDLALVIGLLTVASLGLGFLISALSDSERQAVQLSMLVLLASVFFSGFVLPLDEFAPFVQPIAYLLPVTHGIRLMQDTMLRGATYAGWELWMLGGIALVLFLLTAIRFRWQLTHGPRGR